MKIVCIGGGPAGLYFGILMKKADSSHEIRIIERNRADDTFGFGVVFSDATLGNLERADPETYARITRHFAHWDDIDTHIGGQVFRSTGHGFCGLSRQTLLLILQERCRELGVDLQFETELKLTDGQGLAQFSDADLIVAADGVGSQIRDHYADAFQPTVDHRPNRFVWLGTSYPFEAFTFYFKANQHGLFRVHAYRYQEAGSTFIVECTEDTWRRAGLDKTTEAQTIEYLEELFADELAGHRLIDNRSIWRSFPTVSNRRWHHDNIVLVGDAAHTAHFSIGSGTKLAMEDCIDLCQALTQEPSPEKNLPRALARYETMRRPDVSKWQAAAQVSLEWFENTERYMHLPPEQFTFSLLTRSLRVNHKNLEKRDPALVARFDRLFAKRARAQIARQEIADMTLDERAWPPMFTPFRVRDVVVDNRVVALAAAVNRARDGVVGDYHLVHMGGLALGGASWISSESAAVSAEGRADIGSAGLYSDACVAGFSRIADFVHDVSRGYLCAVLGHAGRRADPNMGQPTLAASAIPYRAGDPVPRALGGDDFDRIRAAFVSAAERADQADIDALTIDMAGGGLLAGFLSPLSNRRDDEYGGSLDNRLRWPRAIVRAMRAVWPDHKPLSARISATDWAPRGQRGLVGADAVAIARALVGDGCDLIEVTTGGNVSDEEPQVARLYQARFADQVRNEARVPIVAIDDFSSYADINAILAGGRADLCAPTRTLLYAPNYVRHAAAAQNHAMTWPSELAAARGFKLRD